MPEPDNDHEEYVVLDRVDDAVVTDSDAETCSTLKRSGTWWSGILSEQGDGTLDAAAGLRIEFA